MPALSIDDAQKAKWYFSDGFDAYARLWYHYGRYEVSQGKNDTYSGKVITQNCVITWLVSHADRVVFRVARMLCNVH